MRAFGNHRVRCCAAMAISSDYSAPVWVNGFACRNCSEVDQARRNIDPANPSAGPFGLNGASAGTRNHFAAEARQQDLLEERHRAQMAARASPVAAAYGAGALATAATGTLVDRTV